MKLVKVLFIAALSTSFASAATITVSPGAAFLGQGLNVTVGGEIVPNFSVAVGNWNSSTNTWTQFGGPVLDDGTVNASITAQSPTSLNNQLLHVFVGLSTSLDNVVSNSVAGGSSFVILQSTQNTAFPPDVTAAGGTTFNAALGSGVFVVESGDFLGIEGNNLNFIPEPSVALLGAFGVLGLLRRRR